MKAFITAALILSVAAANAQKNYRFWSAMPKVENSAAVAGDAIELPKFSDSSIIVLRPAGPAVVFGLPGNKVIAGFGISLEKNIWVPKTEKWWTKVSGAVLLYVGASVTPNQPFPENSLPDIISRTIGGGVHFSFLNKLASAGFGYLDGSKIYTIGSIIPLNN